HVRQGLGRNQKRMYVPGGLVANVPLSPSLPSWPAPPRPPHAFRHVSVRSHAQHRDLVVTRPIQAFVVGEPCCASELSAVLGRPALKRGSPRLVGAYVHESDAVAAREQLSNAVHEPLE